MHINPTPIGAKGWISGNGVPTAEGAPAQNGFHYLNLDTADVYRKSAGDWELVGNIGGDQTFRLAGYTEVHHADVLTAGIVTYSYATANILDLTGANAITGDITINFDFAGVPTDEAISFTVFTEQDGVGGHAINWDALADFGDIGVTPVTSAGALEEYNFRAPTVAGPIHGSKSWSKA
jgi:hypothetical protein